ncbi:aminoglycoside phosphotransferase family protein [Pseudoxanthomonas sp. PXM04]|uniref:aminoglycoside phosphotransferase family protein n=1 Tax=Pseudoxanthomonas sp. PXM04 TaxID=2769297 RepID=UPI0017846DF0|nr:aminoglycoside phosphotransferase family protein [Pseudoxanthomonas sp. PXM04]MBD9378351.1 phosphotransferase [Pseudoxanthomonas sp. PXM04]
MKPPSSDWQPLLDQWQLTVDGDAFATPGSQLLPVRWRGRPAMLKRALTAEEKSGGALMRWWNGDGAAHVYGHEDDTLLMERATGTRDLFAMALDGRDDEASRILCATLARLYAPRAAPPPAHLVPLRPWFRSLEAASGENTRFARSWATARALLEHPQDPVVLHGDMHHRNVLDFDERGWLAIDPKCVTGERGFDYANLLTNPDLPTVTRPERFHRQFDVIAEAARLEPQRLLRWVVAFAGLSAAWFLEDEDEQGIASDFAVADLAQAMLDG